MNNIKQYLKSKTIIFALMLAAFGVIESQIQVFAPFMNAQVFGLFSTIIGVIVATLRVATTTAIADK